MPRCQISETKNLRLKTLLCCGFQNHPLSQELGMHVFVLQLLPEIQRMLVCHVTLRKILRKCGAYHAHGRGLDHPRSCLQTELHQILCTSQIYILDQSSAGKMLHHCGTVDDCIDLLFLRSHDGGKIRYISIQNEDTVIHQLQNIVIKVIEI